MRQSEEADMNELEKLDRELRRLELEIVFDCFTQDWEETQGRDDLWRPIKVFHQAELPAGFPLIMNL
jgi:hypothetical protein